MFEAAVVNVQVKIRTREVGANVIEAVEERAKAMTEGVCTRHGYVKLGSAEVLGVSEGVLSRIDMGQHYTFQVEMKIDVCNPVRGFRFWGVVRSTNWLGALVEGGYRDADGTMVPVISAVVVKNPTQTKNEAPLDDVKVGDELYLEFLSGSVKAGDARVSAFARTLDPPRQTSPDEVLPEASTTTT